MTAWLMGNILILLARMKIIMVDPIKASTKEPKVSASGYDVKTSDYFAGDRADMLALLNNEVSEGMLEIGCGQGATGKLALESKLTERYVGVELMPDAALEAKKWLSHVEVGDAETMDLARLSGPFGAILCSEVLEHLHDPWAMVEKLAQQLTSGGVLIASSPNIASKGIVLSLLRGNFEYTEFGVMDRTHLRWFAPKNYRAMFEEAGLQIECCKPVSALTWKGRLVNMLTFNKFQHLFWTQTMIVARKP